MVYSPQLPRAAVPGNRQPQAAVSMTYICCTATAESTKANSGRLGCDDLAIWRSGDPHMNIGGLPQCNPPCFSRPSEDDTCAQFGSNLWRTRENLIDGRRRQLAKF